MKPFLRIFLIGSLLLASNGAGTVLAAPQENHQHQEGPAVQSQEPSPIESIDPQIVGDEYWDSQFLQGVNYAPAPSNTSIFTIAVNGTDVYMGGDLDQAGGVAVSNIAKWDTAAHRWSALGSGINNRVYAIAAHGNDVYAGGYFTQAGGVAVSSLAHWNTTTQTWSAVGGELTIPGFSPEVKAIAVAPNGDVYVGGSFTAAGGVTVNNIARWDGNSWHALSSGTAGTSPDVNAIAINGSDVYVGGDFTSAGSCSCKYVAHWNGTAWSALGGGVSGFNTTVYAIAISGTNVYVGGKFDTVIDPPSTPHAARNVALWKAASSTWDTMGGGVDDPDVAALAVGSDGVYVGGRFTDLADGTTTVNRLALWTGSAWESLGTGGISPKIGVNSNLYALAYSAAENSIYLGGFFTKAGPWVLNHVGRWSIADADFYGLGNSVDGPVYALEQIGSKIYLGGIFNSAGGIPVKSIAAWDLATKTWSALGSGISGCSGLLFTCTTTVYALKRDGNKLLVGGNFTSAGGNPASFVATWDPVASTWSSLGTGVTCTGLICTASVYALETTVGYGNIVGGDFTIAGGNPANNIARWGSVWSSFGSGVTGGAVQALSYHKTSSDDTLYIGGAFTAPTARFARWKGGIWESAGSVPNNSVSSILGLDDSHLIVGGDFTQVGTDSINHVAIYDTTHSTWSMVGAGLDSSVASLDSDGSKIFAAGDFTTSGTTGVSRVAVYSDGAWTGLGSGADDTVNSVKYDGHSVFIGGSFFNAGSKPSTFFGRWTPPYATYLPLTLTP